MTTHTAPERKRRRIATLRRRLPAILGALASITILIVALWFLQRQISGLSFGSIIANTRTVPAPALLAAILCAACSYVVLTGFDATGLGYLRHQVPYRNVALTSFMAFAVGHNVGFSALSGGSIRYRMYTLAGLTAADIAKLIMFIAGTYSLGASGLLGAALLKMPAAQIAVFPVQPEWIMLAGGLFLLVPFVYLGITLLRRKPMRFGNWRLAMPRPALALTQISLSIGDLLFAAATLYVLAAPLLDIGFFPFLGIYLLAMGAGVLSGVPGGLGVFEAILVAAFPHVQAGALLGIIILYRVIYYLAPLTLALVLLVTHEARHHGQVLKSSTAKAVDWLSGIAPQLIGSVVFLAGAVLLISDARPLTAQRLVLVSQLIPLPIMELSHLLSGIMGMALLILVRGLFRRLARAWRTALVALTSGVFFSLFKGLYVIEALVLGTIAFALWLSRDEFTRSDAIISQRFPLPWIAAIVLVTGTALAFTFLSLRDEGYSGLTINEFAHDAHAPRMLRTMLLAIATGVFFTLWKSFHARRRKIPPLATSADLDTVREVLNTAEHPLANAALIGKKHLLWSADRQAFIMYQISGDSWVACGDPVGPVRYHQELAWAFREIVERYEGVPVFYEVADTSRALYADLGLTMSRIGDQGTLSLQEFSLQDPLLSSLRQTHQNVRNIGAMFDVIPRTGVVAIMGDLCRIPDGSAITSSRVIPAFSLGRLAPQHLSGFDCAVVKINGTIVAFASIWPAQGAYNLAADLVRYDPDAAAGLLEFLFIEIMLWGKARGFRSFDLGMTPLPEVEERSLAPVWHDIGHHIFVHGEHFAGFSELRNFKSQFRPQWQPRYLAAPGGWRKLPRALTDAATLIKPV